jgi:PAS domain S-box-containing protein
MPEWFKGLGMKEEHMGTRIRVFAVWWSVFLFCAPAAGLAARVTVGIYDCRPLVCTAEKPSDPPLMMGLLRAVAEVEGWTLATVPGTLAEHWDGLREGRLDLLASAPLPGESDGSFSFTREGVLSTWGQLFSAPGLRIGSLMDLNGLTVGLLRGDPYGQALRELVHGLGLRCEFVWMDHYHEVFRALAWGRVAVGAVDRLFGAEQAERYGVQPTPVVFAPREYGFAAPATDRGRKLIEIVDRRLTAMRADPASPYHQMVARAVNPGAAPGFPVWLKWSLGLGVCLLLVSLGLSFMLRRRVRVQNRSLRRKNEALKTEIAMRREAEATLRRQKSYLETLREMSMGIVRHLNPDMLLERILSRAAKLADAETGFLYLYHREEDALVMRAGLGICRGHVGIRRATDQGLAGRVFQTGRTLVLEDYATWAGRMADPRYDGIRAVVGVPLISDGRVFGVLGVGDGRSGPVFDAHRVAVLGHFARLAGVAMDNAFLYDRLRRELERRERAEKRLRESRDRFEEVLDAVPAGIVLVDAATLRIVYANPAAARMAGEERTALCGRKCDRLLCNTESHCRNACPVLADPAGTAIGEGFVNAADGTRTPVLKSVYSARLGTKTFLVESFIDLRALKAAEAEREALEAALNDARHMEALGVMAGGIAHDFKNILTPIMGHAEMALGRTPRESQARRHLEEVMGAARRARELTRQVLSFSRCGPAEPEIIDAAPVAGEVVRLLESTLSAGIALRTDLSPDPLRVTANDTQIHQLLMNLCTNAVQAMSDGGGVLRVTAVRESGNEGEWALLTVADTGRGMTPEVHARLFEPYFTTRADREGTGLGMSVVHGIVEALKGRISVDSAPGRGTTIQVRIPLAAGEKISGQVSVWEMPTERRASHEARLLLVDDDPLVVQVQGEILSNFGFQVDAFQRSRAALERFQADPEAFDLLVTDRSMPEVTGEELAAAVQRLRPGFPVVVCTGAEEGIPREDARGMGIREVLRKPVPAARLAEAARRALGFGERQDRPSTPSFPAAPIVDPKRDSVKTA